MNELDGGEWVKLLLLLLVLRRHQRLVSDWEFPPMPNLVPHLDQQVVEGPVSVFDESRQTAQKHHPRHLAKGEYLGKESYREARRMRVRIFDLENESRVRVWD